MFARLGNVIYWMALLIAVGCFCFGLYQQLFHSPDMENYLLQLQWHAGQTWDEYKKKEIDDYKLQAKIASGAAIAIALVGKAIQYILGGTWKLSDLE